MLCTRGKRKRRERKRRCSGGCWAFGERRKHPKSRRGVVCLTLGQLLVRWVGLGQSHNGGDSHWRVRSEGLS